MHGLQVFDPETVDLPDQATLLGSADMEAQQERQARSLQLLKHAHYLHKSGAGRLTLPGQPLRHAGGAVVQFDDLLVRCRQTVCSCLLLVLHAKTCYRY